MIFLQIQLLTSGISATFVTRNEKQGKNLHCWLSRYHGKLIIFRGWSCPLWRWSWHKAISQSMVQSESFCLTLFVLFCFLISFSSSPFPSYFVQSAWIYVFILGLPLLFPCWFFIRICPFFTCWPIRTHPRASTPSAPTTLPLS